jgi:NAD(P)-dependent dehydrogenase (short-subunit alcohol dehydrogenase family)
MAAEPQTHTRQLFDLTGRVAIVTGGAAGLGRQMAEGLAEMGANLVLCSRKKDHCEKAAEELQSKGIAALGLGCDVTNPASIQEIVDGTLARFGKIEILINNAGVSWGAPVERMPVEAWRKVIEVNLTGTFLFSQAVGQVMMKQRKGKIINIASIAGMAGSPDELQAIGYAASKGGVITFTRDLARKWARYGINVNAIAPGWFPTHMSAGLIEKYREKLLAGIPLGRFGNEHDLKGAAVFLASSASDFVTGHILAVDGGQSA